MHQLPEYYTMFAGKIISPEFGGGGATAPFPRLLQATRYTYMRHFFIPYGTIGQNQARRYV